MQPEAVIAAQNFNQPVGVNVDAALFCTECLVSLFGNEEAADMAIAAIRQPMKTSKSATDGMDALSNLSTVLLKTRIKSEIEKVKYLETKNKEAEKSLVSADGVRIAAFNKGRMVRDAFLNIPDRVASILTKETDTNRIHEILTKEIRQIIEEILESG